MIKLKSNLNLIVLDGFIAIVVFCILYNFMVLPGTIRNDESSAQRSRNILMRYEHALNDSTEKYARNVLQIPPAYDIKIDIRDKNLIQNKFEISIRIIDTASKERLDPSDYYPIIKPDSLEKCIASKLKKKFSAQEGYKFVYSLIIVTKSNIYPRIELPLQRNEWREIQID